MSKGPQIITPDFADVERIVAALEADTRLSSWSIVKIPSKADPRPIGVQMSMGGRSAGEPYIFAYAKAYDVVSAYDEARATIDNAERSAKDGGTE